MPHLAALTPARWQVEHIDEEVSPVDVNAQTGLVGITFHTPSAPHACRIADRFRSRGIAVVLGGPHVTLLSEEAAQHADTIFVGEAEGLWQKFLIAFERGEQLKVYQPDHIPSLEHAPQAQIESVSQASMNEVRKRFNRVEEYRSIIDRIHAHGIAVQAGMMFGFDSDTPSIFTESVDFLEQAGVQNATFNILTPFPGTPLFQRMESEGRILTYDWSKYNNRTDVVFQPKQMSREKLLTGFQSAVWRFYSLGSIRKRLSHSPVGLEWTLPLNLAYHLSLRRYGLERG